MTFCLAAAGRVGNEWAARGGDSELGDAELAVIADVAAVHVSGFQAFFSGSDTSTSRMKEETEHAISQDIRSVLNTMAATLLQDCDEKCNLITQQVETLMLNVFKSTCFVGWSLKRGEAILTIFSLQTKDLPSHMAE